MAKISVDVAGTFTDLALEAGAKNGGALHVFDHKVPNTPRDQSDRVVRGPTEICDIARVSRAEIDLIIHGATVTTNIARLFSRCPLSKIRQREEA